MPVVDPEVNGRRPVAVVGAGAAGLLAALFAAREGADVVLLERTGDGGRKILISGGGRCNILPSEVAYDRYVTDSSPNTLRKILRSWPLAEQRSFFEAELGMPLELEEESGKLFPSNHRARDVRDRLVARARDAGVRIWFDASVVGLAPAEGAWRVDLAGSSPLEASAVVMATGGLSVPATGSDGTGLSVAERLGHRLHPVYPALTPLIAEPHPHVSLAGVSLTATIRVPGSNPSFETTGGFLFTHRGWSGPAVLDVSHFATRAEASDERPKILIRWTDLDARDWVAAFRSGSGTVRSALAPHLPRRLSEWLLAHAGVPYDTPISQLRREGRGRLVEGLTAYALPWTGSEGFKKAEVTGGGVALSEVDPRTLESRRAPGLYFCGEILDAFGPIGGYNFLWAWATGRAAGQSVARAVQRSVS
jgi:predicted Rossmann fold flavoprotein